MADPRFAQFASDNSVARPDAAFWEQRVYFDGVPRRRRDMVTALALTPGMTEQAARLLLVSAPVSDGSPPLPPPVGWVGNAAAFGLGGLWEALMHPRGARGWFARKEEPVPDLVPDNILTDTSEEAKAAAVMPRCEVLRADLPEAVRSIGAVWARRLTGAEVEDVTSYTRSAYRDVNPALRDADGDPSRVPPGMAKDIIGGLLSAAAKVEKFPEPVMCWRVLNLEDAKMARFLAVAARAASRRDTISMPVFSSTSMNPAYVCSRTRAGDDGKHSGATEGGSDGRQKIILEITTRTGLPVGATHMSPFDEENELILTPGTKFRVKGIKTVRLKTGGTEDEDKGFRRVLQLEAVSG